MFAKYLLAFLVVTFCFTSNEVKAESPVERVKLIIESIFTGRAIECFKGAVENCKSHWKDPPAAIDCAYKFIDDHIGHCGVMTSSGGSGQSGSSGGTGQSG